MNRNHRLWLGLMLLLETSSRTEEPPLPPRVTARWELPPETVRPERQNATIPALQGPATLHYLAHSHDGRRLAVVTWRDLYALDTRDGQVRHLAAVDFPPDVRFSPDDWLLALLDRGGKVAMWETNAWELIVSRTGGNVPRARLSPHLDQVVGQRLKRAVQVLEGIGSVEAVKQLMLLSVRPDDSAGDAIAALERLRRANR